MEGGGRRLLRFVRLPKPLHGRIGDGGDAIGVNGFLDLRLFFPGRIGQGRRCGNQTGFIGIAAIADRPEVDVIELDRRHQAFVVRNETRHIARHTRFELLEIDRGDREVSDLADRRQRIRRGLFDLLQNVELIGHDLEVFLGGIKLVGQRSKLILQGRNLLLSGRKPFDIDNGHGGLRRWREGNE